MPKRDDYSGGETYDIYKVGSDESRVLPSKFRFRLRSLPARNQSRFVPGERLKKKGWTEFDMTLRGPYMVGNTVINGKDFAVTLELLDLGENDAIDKRITFDYFEVHDHDKLHEAKPKELHEIIEAAKTADDSSAPIIKHLGTAHGEN